MLLSLLSKRSLTVESRDAYGFSVRPQNLQRYKEYTNIYKEEEDERSRKWKVFLEQQEASVDAHSSGTDKLDKDNTETINSADKHDDKDDNSVGKPHTSDIQATNDIEKKVVTSDLNEEEPVPLGAKRKAVQTWAEIRPSLGALDYMMSFRVKKNKITKNEHVITGASEDKNVEEQCVNEMLDDSMNTTVTEGQPFFPWEQELEFLVQGGVPRNLRGEVWQALVGARSRHVEKYYQDLFKPEGHAGDDQNNVKSTSGSVNEGICLGHFQDIQPEMRVAMHFFAGLLLLIVPEENAFWTLVGIIDD
ncbi:GTPase-activating protein [Lithospermum erythrorhizon]|uniref:GTPase-activating protein n=1 Tax=Lithospermum erythrorhizon TaxID=34254 RepID=A0AAV3PS36_LITER